MQVLTLTHLLNESCTKVVLTLVKYCITMLVNLLDQGVHPQSKYPIIYFRFLGTYLRKRISSQYLPIWDHCFTGCTFRSVSSRVLGRVFDENVHCQFFIFFSLLWSQLLQGFQFNKSSANKDGILLKGKDFLQREKLGKHFLQHVIRKIASDSESNDYVIA